MVSCRHFSVTQGQSQSSWYSQVWIMWGQSISLLIWWCCCCFLCFFLMLGLGCLGLFTPSIKGSQFSFPLLSHLENVSQQCIFVVRFSVTYLFLYVKVNSQNIPSQFCTIWAQIMCNWIAAYMMVKCWLKVNCGEKFGLVCKVLVKPGQIEFYNSLLVYDDSLITAIIHQIFYSHETPEEPYCTSSKILLDVYRSLDACPV